MKKFMKMKNLIKIVALILAVAFCLQIVSVFAMENKSFLLSSVHRSLENGPYIPPFYKQSYFPPYSKSLNCFSLAGKAVVIDNSKILVFDLKNIQTPEMPTIVREISFSGDVVNEEGLAINSAGTKVAVATKSQGIQVFDTANGKLIHTYPPTVEFKKLSFTNHTSTNNGRPSHTYENLNIERGNDGLIVYELDRKPVSSSLINKILQHKMTKLVGICALGAGVVGLIGYGISKLFGKAKESNPMAKKPVQKVLRPTGG